MNKRRLIERIARILHDQKWSWWDAPHPIGEMRILETVERLMESNENSRDAYDYLSPLVTSTGGITVESFLDDEKWVHNISVQVGRVEDGEWKVER